MPQCHIKRFPVCYHAQGAVEIAAELHAEIDAGRVAEIGIDTYRVAVAEMAGDATRWAPRSRETADHSLPYEAKFRGLFTHYGPASQCDAVLDALWQFDSARDVGPLMGLLVREPSNAAIGINQ